MGLASKGSPSSNDRDMLYFERQAAVATRLNLLTDSWLDAAAPTLVFPRLEGEPLDDWLAGQTQMLSSLTWVSLARRILQQLAQLHRLGYAHTQLRPEHVWVDSAKQIHLLGLGQCEPIGEYSESRTPGIAYEAPECARAGEVSSAQDIYSAAVVIDELAAGNFAATPIGRCMQAEWPCDRPTASELVELFASYERELLGRHAVAA